MRLIQAMLPAGTRESVADALTEEGVTFAFADETSVDDRALLFAPAETEDVENIVDMLRDAGVEDEGYIVLSEATVVTEQSVDIPEERSGPGHRVSREELHATMTEELRNPAEYAIFTVLSAVFAAAGLLLDSATVIVGSMVVSPVLGPAVASSVGTVVDDDGIVRKGVIRQVSGAGIAVSSAAVFALFARLVFAPHPDLHSLSQVNAFSSPVALTLAIALVAGIAGALSLTSGASTSLIGVAVAAALVPPSALVGVGIAYGEPALAVGAAVVVIVNLLSINLTSLITFRVAGYRPENWFAQRKVSRLFTRRTLVLALAVLVVSSVVVVATLNQRQNAAFEREVQRIAERISAPLSVDVRYETGFLVGDPHRVVVRTQSTQETFARRLRERIRKRTGEDVSVVVYEATGVAGRNRSALLESGVAFESPVQSSATACP